jgi:hypothetical protein
LGCEDSRGLLQVVDVAAGHQERDAFVGFLAALSVNAVVFLLL